MRRSGETAAGGRARAGRGGRVDARLAGLALAATLAGCVSPGPRPLPTAPSTAASATSLRRNPEALDLAPLPKRTIDPAHLAPLDVAILAVLNNPDLAAKRAATGVAAAQVFAAGLLPDPQVGLSADFPEPGQQATTAYGLAPSLDIAGLIARAPALKAARAQRRQSDLDLLWAEWGTAQQARILAWTVLADEAKAKALAELDRILAGRAEASRRALARGDLPAATTSADEALAIDTRTALAQARHDATKARLDLNALIGLAPGVRLPLTTGGAGEWDKAALDRARAELARRRPDLLALQAGYAAEQANLRKAVLAQFPLLNLGFNAARDNTGIVSNGVAATFALPIFNGGRGQIAIEKATREQLRAEYQARLDQADAEAAADVAERTSADAQAARLARELPALSAVWGRAETAFARNDLDATSYLTLAQNLLDKTADLQDRRLAARLAEIQLETALFLPPAGSESRP